MSVERIKNAVIANSTNLQREKFKDAMANYTMKKLLEDGTIAWGTVKNVPVYVRFFADNSIVSELADQSGLNVTEYLGNLDSKGIVGDDVNTAIIFKNRRGDIIAYVSEFKNIRNFKNYKTYEIKPEGYEFFHISILTTHKGGPEQINLRSTFRLWSMLYVPFNKASKGMGIPVLYYIGTEKDAVTSTTWNGEDAVETAHKIIGMLQEKYPKVDLENNTDKRFVEFPYMGDAYIYNRNNVGYNGRNSDGIYTAPILLKIMATYYNDLESENITAYLNGEFDDSEGYYFKFKSMAATHPVTDEDVQETSPKQNVDKGIKSANTLLEAIDNMV